MEFYHVPVLLNETISGLAVQPNGIYVDGTLGGGGHAKEILKQLTTGRLIGFDRDCEAIAVCRERLAEFSEKITFINRNFNDILQVLQELEIEKIDGAVLDLGVSSYQLDCAERGFSYNHDAPLDMRMDKSSAVTAYNVVNEYSEKRLSDIIFQYGEERWAQRIAEFIVEERKKAPLQTTRQLVSVIKKAVPKGARTDGPHPAKRTFQAIRIEVNGELTFLKQAISDFIDCLSPGGRLCVITFHSLEDRIVKTAFAQAAKGCICPDDLPVCICGRKPAGRIITKKPIVPGKTELFNNPRARSAHLRIFEKR